MSTGDDTGEIDLQWAVDQIKATRGQGICSRMRALDMDPEVHFAGGDWRYSDFSGEALRGFDFKNARLYMATFECANVEKADFRGATDLHTTRFHLAMNWQNAELDDGQRVAIAAKAKEKSESLPSDGEGWFRLIRACNTFDEARTLIQAMDETDFRLNIFAYTAALDIAKREFAFDKGYALYQSHLAAKGYVDLPFLTAAMGVAPSAKNAQIIMRRIKESFSPDAKCYNMLISKHIDDFEGAIKIFHEMSVRRLDITKWTAFSLFDCCSDFPQIIQVLVHCYCSGLDIDNWNYVDEARIHLKRAYNPQNSYPEIYQQSFDFTSNLSPLETLIQLIELEIESPDRESILKKLSN